MRYDRLQEQKIFKEEAPAKDRATMRWHDKDKADYSNHSDMKTRKKAPQKKSK